MSRQKNNFKLTKNTLKIKKSNECGIIITFYEFFDVRGVKVCLKTITLMLKK